MHSLIPRVAAGGWTLCEADGESEGAMIELRWLGIVFAICMARRVRTVGEAPDASPAPGTPNPDTSAPACAAVGEPTRSDLCAPGTTVMAPEHHA